MLSGAERPRAVPQMEGKSEAKDGSHAAWDREQGPPDQEALSAGVGVKPEDKDKQGMT